MKVIVMIDNYNDCNDISTCEKLINNVCIHMII